MRTTLIAVLLVLFWTPLFGQTAKPAEYRETMDVDIVLVDVTVTDREGHQILGLGKDDFIVKENGVPQPIQSVDYFTNRTLLTGREEQAKFQVEKVKEERYFIIFIDKVFDTDQQRMNLRSELLRASRSIADFIDEDILPQDQVAILGFDSRLKVFADFTTDKARLKKAVNQAIGFGSGIVSAPAGAGEASILRHLTKKQLMRSGDMFGALALVGQAVKPIPARKVMVLFSPGAWHVRFNARLLTQDPRYRAMAQALNGANVTVDTVNLIRAGVAPDNDLSRVADDTGGEFFWNVVNFVTPLRLIENANNGYYLITFQARKPKGESGYQKIDVSLTNPEFEIRAREGYQYGTSPGSSGGS